MGIYILRRLALIIPTLVGIMLLNFIIVQAAPGGGVMGVVAGGATRTEAMTASAPSPARIHKARNS